MTQDLYPSRIREQPSIIERVDPVVYRNHKTDEGPLSHNRWLAMSKKGTSVFVDFFPRRKCKNGEMN